MMNNTVIHCRCSFTNCTVQKKTIARVTEPNPVLDVGTQQRACVNFHAGSSWIALARTRDQVRTRSPQSTGAEATRGVLPRTQPRGLLRSGPQRGPSTTSKRGGAGPEPQAQGSNSPQTPHCIQEHNQQRSETTVVTENTSHFCKPTCSLSQAMQKAAQEDQQHNARGTRSSKWRNSGKGTLPVPGMALLFIPTALGNVNNTTSCTSLIAGGSRNFGAQSTEGFYAPNGATLHCSAWATVCPSSSTLQGHISATPANAIRH